MSLLTRGLGEPGALVTRGLGSPGVNIPPAGGVEGAVGVSVLDGTVDEQLALQVEDAFAAILEEIASLTQLVGASDEVPVLSATMGASLTLAAEVAVSEVEGAGAVSAPMEATAGADAALSVADGAGEGIVGDTDTENPGSVGQDGTHLGGGPNGN